MPTTERAGWQKELPRSLQNHLKNTLAPNAISQSRKVGRMNKKVHSFKKKILLILRVETSTLFWNILREWERKVSLTILKLWKADWAVLRAKLQNQIKTKRGKKSRMRYREWKTRRGSLMKIRAGDFQREFGNENHHLLHLKPKGQSVQVFEKTQNWSNYAIVIHSICCKSILQMRYISLAKGKLKVLQEGRKRN